MFQAFTFNGCPCQCVALNTLLSLKVDIVEPVIQWTDHSISPGDLAATPGQGFILYSEEWMERGVTYLSELLMGFSLKLCVCLSASNLQHFSLMCHLHFCYSLSLHSADSCACQLEL